VRQLVIKLLNIIDARCNHEVWSGLCDICYWKLLWTSVQKNSTFVETG